MIRWAAVLFVVASAAAALAWTHGYDSRHGGEIVDEVLVYEITASDSVTARVPAGVETVLLTLWAVVPPQEVGPADQAYPYGTLVELRDERDAERGSRRYGTASRITSNPHVRTERGFAARLVDSEDWVTDPRTLEVDTRAIGARGGKIVVRAVPGERSRLLVRLSYRFQRGRLERRLFERSLDRDEYRRILGQTTALGFVDLPPGARAQALSTWSRRLTAEGQSGRDYRLRRLLVGDYRSLSAQVEPRQLAFPLSPGRRAVLNLVGPVQLRAIASPGVELRVVEGDRPHSALMVPASGYADIALRGQGLRSVLVAAGETAAVRFTVPRDQARAQVGDVDRVIQADGRVQIGPDTRAHVYHRLDRALPLTYRVAPGQGPFRIRVRAILDPQRVDGAGARPARIIARFRDELGAVQHAEQDVELVRSEFETFGELGDATDAAIVYLHPPAGVDRIELFGDRELCISAAVSEPGVEIGIERSPYAEAPLALDRYWRYAPHEIARWSTTRPIASEAEQALDRAVKLRAQVRIERRFTPPRGSLPQRAVAPLGAPVQRRLWSERPVALLEEDSSQLFELAGSSRVVVADRGLRSRRIGLRFFTDAEALGGTLRVLLDGEARVQHKLAIQSGRLEIPAAPGVHRLAIEGLGPRGVAYSDARPVGATEFVQSRAVAELRVGRPLRFVVPSQPGVSYSLLVFAATEGVGAPFRVEYAIDGGRVQRAPGIFFRHRTQETGVLEAVSGDYERALILESQRDDPPRASAAPDGVSRLRIRLGDDLALERHRVRLSLVKTAGGPSRVWVRAVLLGEDAPERAPRHRAFTRPSSSRAATSEEAQQ